MHGKRALQPADYLEKLLYGSRGVSSISSGRIDQNKGKFVDITLISRLEGPRDCCLDVWTPGFRPLLRD